MNTSTYYAVLDSKSQYDMAQSEIVECFGDYEHPLDAITRFVTFYDPDKYFLYSYHQANLDSDVEQLTHVPVKLPSYESIVAQLSFS